MSDDNNENDRTVLSIVAIDEDLREVLSRDPGSVALVIGRRIIDGAVHVDCLFEKLQTLDRNGQALLLEALIKAAELVTAYLASDPDTSEPSWLRLPQCRPTVPERSSRRLSWFRKQPLVLEKAAALGIELLLGIRAIEDRAEVVFEYGVLDGRDPGLLVALREAADAVAIQRPQK